MKKNKSTKELKDEAKAALSANTQKKVLLYAIPVVYAIISNIQVFQNWVQDMKSMTDYQVPPATSSILLSLPVGFAIQIITMLVIFIYMDLFKQPDSKIHPIQDILDKINIRLLLKLLVISIWMSIYIFLWLLLPVTLIIISASIGSVVGSETALTLIPLVFLTVIAGVVLFINRGFAYSQSFYILYDRYRANNYDVTARQVIKESVVLMKGEKTNFFVLQLSFILWGFLVAFTGGLASFWVTPYATMTNIAFYYNLQTEKNDTVTTDVGVTEKSDNVTADGIEKSNTVTADGAENSDTATVDVAEKNDTVTADGAEKNDTDIV
ncbi:MAG: DUF975 family protein [Streptococcaceae bacterium]|jgi:uncharacterized membrane protein|nr:DUF975 family protein [Streptococcaceae bacterium]